MTSPRSAEASAPLIVDTRGMRCPWPVLRAARAMRDADHIMLISDDPIARRDVPEMALARGWRYEMANEGDLSRISLFRGDE
ncbi:MAG: sulfurtransferase TusA family protein [Sphingobium sp.]